MKKVYNYIKYEKMELEMSDITIKYKKGFTISELVVVLALCIVMASMTIITVNVVSKIVSKSKAENDMVNELDICYEFIVKRFHDFDEDSNIYDVNGEDLVISSDGKDYSFVLKDNYIYFISGSEELGKVECKNFSRLSFVKVKDNIFKCILVANDDQVYDFLISKRSK